MLASIIILALLNLAALSFALFTTIQARKQGEAEAIRLTILAESAMAHIRAKSLEEVVSTKSVEKANNLQLDYLQKTLLKQEAKEKAAVKQEPIFAMTDDGKEIDLGEFDVLT